MTYEAEIYRRVAELHIASIDQGFLPSLGPAFLTLLYRAIDHCEGSILIVEHSEGQIVGFIAGSSDIGEVYRELIRNWASLFVTLIPLIIQPRKLIGILEVLRHNRSNKEKLGLPKNELLSIAVAPKVRGTGVAERLYNALVYYFQEREVHSFRIVVGDSLTPAHRFYRRMGAKPNASVEVHPKKKSTVYIHQLRNLSSGRL